MIYPLQRKPSVVYADCMQTPRHQNELGWARRSLGLSLKTVAAVINKDPSTLTRYERGTHLPTLEIALALEVLYRRPIGHLFPALHAELHIRVREREKQLRTNSNRERFSRKEADD